MRTAMNEIIYIDEQPIQRREVQQAAVSSGFFTQDQVETLEPSNTVDETIDTILGYKCKVLITDYRLNEHKAGVEFNGIDLIREFQNRFLMFPCFVTTAFAGEASTAGFDINIIFPKSDFIDGKNNASDLPFFERVRKKIKEYEHSLEQMTSKLRELSDKMLTEELSAHDVQKLLDLDSQLEAMLGANHSIPKHLKEEAMKPFRNLISKTEDLIEKIEVELRIDRERN